MNRKDIMYDAFTGKKQMMIPAVPHWWGLYKFQHGGLLEGYEKEHEAWNLRGKELAEYDEKFYLDFEPDMFHLTTGNSIYGNRYDTEEYQEHKKKLQELNSYNDIDDFIKLISESEQRITESGVFEHVKLLSEKYGDQSFITLHEGNPVCRILDEYLGFEQGLIAMLEEPEKVGYFLYQLYDILLNRMKALEKAGADAYAGSETYCTRDIMSPDMYHDLVFPAQQHFYKELKKKGMFSVSYFLGNVVPMMDDINRLGVDALMVEESKKGFQLDVLELRKSLSPEITLFGNLDSVYILQNGTREDVITETKRQLKAADYGSFIMSNGCPISFDTPTENIKAMIQTTHQYRQ